jgi:hypothetical protein
MSNYILGIVLNHSIIIAAILGVIALRHITRSFYPFIFLILLVLINESLSLVLIYNNGNNAVSSNIFVLFEFGLLLYQFYRWNNGRVAKYYFIAAAGIITWLLDNFILNSISQNNSLFRVAYSFVIVLFSIDLVNKIIIYEKGRLRGNAMFIICITFIFYYGCKAFVESFNIFHFGVSDSFLSNLWITLYFVNGVSNIIYAIAILCIPTREEFTLQY